MASVVSKKKAKRASYIKPVKFSSLSAPQRRVAIAKDVIAGLKAKRLLAEQRVYCSTGYDNVGILPKKGDVELADVLINVPQCEVCAKGAMFIAAVEKFDKLKLGVNEVTEGDYYGWGDNEDEEDDGKDTAEQNFNLEIIDDHHKICDHLTNYFTQTQLDLIELAFEGDKGDFYVSEASEEENTIAGLYIERYPDTTKRMVAIMNNIIKNNGTFLCRADI